jgi:nucleolar complex protein 3
MFARTFSRTACVLQALFEVFFRVLKHCSTATANQAAAAAASAAPADDSSSKGVLLQPWPASKVHRKFPLLQPALEGLGRYSHLISVEYFNDLMAVLQEVSSHHQLDVTIVESSC